MKINSWVTFKDDGFNLLKWNCKFLEEMLFHHQCNENWKIENMTWAYYWLVYEKQCYISKNKLYKVSQEVVRYIIERLCIIN